MAGPATYRDWQGNNYWFDGQQWVPFTSMLPPGTQDPNFTPPPGTTGVPGMTAPSYFAPPQGYPGMTIPFSQAGPSAPTTLPVTGNPQAVSAAPASGPRFGVVPQNVGAPSANVRANFVPTPIGGGIAQGRTPAYQGYTPYDYQNAVGTGGKPKPTTATAPRPVDPLAQYKALAAANGVDWNVLRTKYLNQYPDDPKYFNAALEHAVSDGVLYRIANKYQIELNDQTYKEFAQGIGNRSLVGMSAQQLRQALENTPMRGHNYAIEEAVREMMGTQLKSPAASPAPQASAQAQPTAQAPTQPKPVEAQKPIEPPKIDQPKPVSYFTPEETPGAMNPLKKWYEF